jgi:hypothetical protein
VNRADGDVSAAGAHRTDAAHRRLLARELLASGLYVDLVLLAALVAVPANRLPADRVLAAIILGTSLGLLLAHWYAFRLAAHVTTELGHWTPSAAQEATAQLAGGLGVALLGAVPFLLLDGSAALTTALLILASLPAVVGFLIARLRGRARGVALVSAAGVLAVALAVVAVKNALEH